MFHQIIIVVYYHEKSFGPPFKRTPLPKLMMHINLTAPEKEDMVAPIVSSSSRCNCRSVDLNTEVPNYVPSNIFTLVLINLINSRTVSTIKTVTGVIGSESPLIVTVCSQRTDWFLYWCTLTYKLQQDVNLKVPHSQTRVIGLTCDYPAKVLYSK